MTEPDSMANNHTNNSLPRFERKKMVDWYSPIQLATTGLRAIISGVFGNYADKREIQAALANTRESQKPFDFSNRDEVWIDYVSDLGSGWDSTYSVAYLLGREHLEIEDQKNNNYNLQRGNILVMGGDEVYPTATPKEYRNRLVGPYASSLPYVDEEDGSPTLFAIPGNHDWYDGLSSFLKLFCQQRWIGGWKTRQLRSYFAVKLPHNWWLWAPDMQLSADIDKPQIEYFDQMHKLASEGDRIILCAAEPVWVYQEYKSDDKPYRNLEFFTNRYSQKKEKKLDFRLMMAGDMHHYTSFKNTEKENPDWKITSGGGGAFTHPTHQVPEELNLNQGRYKKSESFPGKSESRIMALNNLKFPFINIRFGVFFGVLYLLFGWFFGTGSVESGSFLNLLAENGITDIGMVCSSILTLLLSNPGLTLFLILVFGGILLFADTARKNPMGSWVAGAIHGIFQVILLLSAVWLSSFLVFGMGELAVNSLPGIVLFAIALFICGWLFSGFAMGIYLMIVTILLKTHETEAFSSFRDKDHKNFIRMHLSKDKLTIYPVKIPKAYKNWEKVEDKVNRGDPWFVVKPGEDLNCELIEDPITIY